MALDAAIKLADTDPVRARVALTRLLEGSALGVTDRMRGYDAINKINGVLVFSNRMVATDPLTMQYKVQEGDSLARIAKAQKLEPHNKNFEGYGIHGTIDDDSIGQQRSMGCVRMHAKDVELVYELLTEPNSTITIAP
ncbi:MAG: hypothetical protein EBU31_18715 [Proteobacteria bacterium]|nr:hypothetical protein [Pseudomonadota bacterium]